MKYTRRKPRRHAVHEQVWSIQDRSKIRNISKGKASVELEGGRGRTLKRYQVYGRLMEVLGVKSYFRGPMDYAKTLKLHYRAGDLGLPEKRKRYSYSGSR